MEAVSRMALSHDFFFLIPLLGKHMSTDSLPGLAY